MQGDSPFKPGRVRGAHAPTQGAGAPASTCAHRHEGALGRARAVRNDDPMLVQVERFSRNPGDAALVTVRTPVGTVAASWGGNLESAVARL